jgi:hypothetical protein
MHILLVNNFSDQQKREAICELHARRQLARYD